MRAASGNWPQLRRSVLLYMVAPHPRNPFRAAP
jgi:hypothetical protein